MISLSRLISLTLLAALTGACDRQPVYVPAEWVRVNAGSFLMGSPGTDNQNCP